MKTITKGEAGIFYDFVQPELAVEWSKIADKVGKEEDAWWPDVDDTLSLGNSYYRDMKAERIQLYHAGAQKTNEIYTKHLFDFKIAMVEGLSLLRHPDNPNTELPGIPRRSKLPGPNGEAYWVDLGIHCVTRESRGGDQPHGDYEGLEPYPHLMFSEDTISFSMVLCLNCPPEGGGLKCWPGRKLGNILDDGVEELLLTTTPEHFHYKPGSLAIFDSFRFHQVQKAKLTEAYPVRMVGVMHALYWELPIPHFEYWF